jgi:hypothetical protein
MEQKMEKQKPTKQYSKIITTILTTLTAISTQASVKLNTSAPKLNSATVPTLDFSFDITNQFDFSEVEDLSAVQFEATYGKIEWDWDITKILWNFPRYYYYKIVTLPNYSTCYFYGINKELDLIQVGRCNHPNGHFLVELNNMTYEKYLTMRVTNFWNFGKREINEERFVVLSYLEIGDSEADGNDRAKLKLLRDGKSREFMVFREEGQRDYDIIGKVNKNDFWEKEEFFFYWKTSNGEKKFNEGKINYFSIEGGEIKQNSTLTLFTQEELEQIDDLLRLTCLYRSYNDLYCFAHVQLKSGKKENRLLKRSHKIGGNSFDLIFKFEFEIGQIYLDPQPFPFSLKNESVFFSFNSNIGGTALMKYCKIQNGKFNIEDFSTYQTDCETVNHSNRFPLDVYVSELWVRHDIVIILGKVRKNQVAFTKRTVFFFTKHTYGNQKNKYNYMHLCLTKEVKGLSYISLTNRQILPTKGKMIPYLKYSLTKDDEHYKWGNTYKKEEFVLKAIDPNTNTSAKVSIFIKTRHFYKGLILHLASYAMPNKSDYIEIMNSLYNQQLYDIHFFCHSDYSRLQVESNRQFKIKVHQYWYYYFPNVIKDTSKAQAELPYEGGCDGWQSSSYGNTTGSSCLFFNEIGANRTTAKILIGYQLGIVEYLSVSYLDEESGKFNSPMLINMTKYRIFAQYVRAVNESALFYVVSTEHSSGHLIRFKPHQEKLFLITKADGVNNDHLISSQGIFYSYSSTITGFNFYMEDNEFESQLDYSLIFDPDSCFLDIKSKTIDLNQPKNVEFSLITYDGQRASESVKIEATKDTSTLIYTVKKKFQIKSEQDLEEFQLDLDEHFTFEGHGLLNAYSIVEDFELNSLVRLKFDKKLDLSIDNSIFKNLLQIQKLKNESGIYFALVEPPHPRKLDKMVITSQTPT